MLTSTYLGDLLGKRCMDLYNKQTQEYLISEDAKKMHQVSVDSLANSKVVAGIIGHIKSQANRGFFGGTEYFTDELDVEFIDRNKKEIKLYFKHRGYKIHLDKIIDDIVYCVSVTW